MISTMWRTTMCTAVAFAMLSACGDPVGPKDDLREAQRRWVRSGRTSYSMTVTLSCECVNVYPVIVTVRDGAVQSRRFAHDSSDAGIGSTHYPAVEELFAIIDKNIRRGALRVDAKYDPVLGYPTRVYIDIGEMVDEEMLYNVSGFRVP